MLGFWDVSTSFSSGRKDILTKSVDSTVFSVMDMRTEEQLLLASSLSMTAPEHQLRYTWRDTQTDSRTKSLYTPTATLQ